MSDLDDIYLRAHRDGRWQSLSINEMKYVTDDEIRLLRWGDKLTALLEADPSWQRVSYGWMREVKHE